MATISAPIPGGDPGDYVWIEIENPYLDKVQAVAVFVQELASAINGPISGAIQDALNQITVGELKDLIVKICLDVFKQLSVPIPVPVIPSPNLRAIPENIGVAVEAAAGELVAMGQQSVADAQAEFISKLEECVSSSPVLTALTNCAENLIRGDLLNMIVDIAVGAANDAGFPGSVSLSLPPLELPSITIDQPDVLPPLPVPTNENTEIQATLGSIEQFQSELMAPKMYDVIDSIKQQYEQVLTDLESTILGWITPFLP